MRMRVLIIALLLASFGKVPAHAHAFLEDQAKAAMDAVNRETLAFCASEELQPHFSKTPCKPEDTTLEQMADKSRITNDEKVALSKARSESKKVVNEIDDISLLLQS
jgi:hypothetical protein